MLMPRDIERFLADADAVRSQATRLVDGFRPFLTSWEEGYSDDLARRVDVAAFTRSQAEKLAEIWNDVQVVDLWRGYEVTRLLQACYEARFDLCEVDEEWIVARHADADEFRFRHVKGLMRCARQLRLVD